MKLLHIDAGITGPASVSRQVSSAIVEAVRASNPGLTVVHRDLDADPVPHLSSASLAALAPSDTIQPEAGLSAAVLREFLDAVKSRNLETTCNLRYGHQLTKYGLLANISYRTGRRLTWDDEHERVVGDSVANRLLTRKYRKPWKLAPQRRSTGGLSI